MDYCEKVARHAAFREVAAELRAGRGLTVHVGGLAGGAAPLFVAALRRELGVPVLTLAPTAEQAEEFAADGESYAGEEAALLEPYNVVPLKAVSPNLETSASRVKTLLSLAEGRPWCVASAAAFRRRLAPPDALRNAVRRYRAGDALDLAELEQYLSWLGYERVGMVEGPAQFAHRGAILDIFPAGAEGPARLELFGDEVESIRGFDVWTQRRAGALDELAVYPTREVLLSPERVSKRTRGWTCTGTWTASRICFPSCSTKRPP